MIRRLVLSPSLSRSVAARSARLGGGRLGQTSSALTSLPGTSSSSRSIIRYLHSTRRTHDEEKGKLRKALKATKTEWYNIPVGVGIAVVAVIYALRVREREKGQVKEEADGSVVKKIRPGEPWQVWALSIIPLKALSRAWGYFNEIELPVFMRIPGFKLYAWIFGADISEASESDLRNYRNLAEFFYRQLKPGVRPIDEDAILVSPSDGKVLHFGTVLPGGEVSNVKGMTYSLDALLGTRSEDEFTGPSEEPPKPEKVKKGSWWKFWKWGSKDGGSLLEVGDMDVDQKFAVVNGISYTLPGLLSGDKHEQHSGANQAHGGKPADVSLPPSELPNTTDVDAVKADLDAGKPGWWSPAIQESNKALYFCVIYLAPGDYHRFHSPANWVVERRRHFAGELFSVSPYLQSKLANLFVLNERVVLIGRWRHGLFTMTPVGATNVGSIKIHFDKELRTNSLTHDATAADTHPEEGYAEAVYRSASKVLGGHPLVKGAEIGGFNLGSTIVLVFEAPAGDEEFQWDIKPLQKIKMGERLGSIRKKGVEEQTKADW